MQNPIRRGDGISLHHNRLRADRRRTLIAGGGSLLSCGSILATGVLYAYTRCVRSTPPCVCAPLLRSCGCVASGLLAATSTPTRSWCRFSASPRMSHGAQKMNGVMQDIGRGAPNLLPRGVNFPAPVPRRPDRLAGRRCWLRGPDDHRIRVIPGISPIAPASRRLG